MDERRNKKSRAQTLGEETAAAFAAPIPGDEEPIRSDNLGSYTGRALQDSALRTMDELDFYILHLSPTELGEQSVQFTKPAIEETPVQDADDL